MLGTERRATERLQRSHQISKKQNPTPKDNPPAPREPADITEEIVESSLPPRFMDPAIAGKPCQPSTSNGDMSFNTTGIVENSATTIIQKEFCVDNIWSGVSKIHDMRTQKNYERVIHKRTLSEIEAFEGKVDEWMKEYRAFVDDGVNRKQPCFWS